MDRSLGTVAQPRIQDVTPQIAKTHIVYGSSDSTNPAYSSANRSLNYAEGGSIQRPELERVSIIPLPLKYKDTIGLFGKENHFIRVDVKINRTVSNSCFEEVGWECAMVTPGEPTTVNTYQSAVVDLDADPITVNTYEPVVLDDTLSPKYKAYLSIDLNNFKTGNIYVDSWLDARLYTAEREEHPYDKMYIPENSFFYIGFHARNTRRLPYNVECLIGDEYVSELTMTAEDRRYIARTALR